MARRSRLTARSIRLWLVLFILALFPLATFSGKGVSAATSLTWTSRAPMPTARMGSGVAVTPDGTIYVIGGYTKHYYETDGQVATVEAYNSTLDTWQARASLATARGWLGAAIASNGKIYAIGGWNGTALGTVEEYDPATNTWTTKASMPTPRWNLGVTAGSNGKIYAIGGQLEGFGYTSAVEEYDPATDTWATKASMATTRGYLGVTTASNGKIYAIGGWNGSVYLDVVEEYDPSLNTWITRTTMPTARKTELTATPDGQIFAVGGEQNNLPLGTVEEYDITADIWVSQTDLPTPRAYPGVVVSNGTLFAFGGWNGNVVLSVVEGADLSISPTPTPSVIATITVGNGVAGIAVNPNTNRIYVANSVDKTISVIDGATNTVIATIPVGLTPNGIDVNPNTNQIYIANIGGPVDSGKAAVIDGNTNTVVATIPIAFNARGIAVNSTTNRIYITTQTNTTFLPYVEVIDGATNTLAADILPFGNNFNPEGISVNSTTNKIYVADTATFPFEIDGATNTLTPLPLLGSSSVSTFGIDVNPITNRVYLARQRGNCICTGSIDVADRSTDTVTSITVPPVNGNLTSNAASIGVNPTTNHIFVTEGQSGSLLTLDGATNKFIFSPIPGVGGSSDITANPATNRVYVATTTNGNQVSVIEDVPNEPPTPTPTPTATPTPTPSPTPTPALPKKVVVFLQGVCTAISTGTSSVDIDSSFNDLQNLLLTPEYGYKDSDFLLYSYNGGSVDTNGVWHHNAYKDITPIKSDFQTDLFALHNLLLIPYHNHPQHQNITFILVGHSLGGAVAMEEVIQKVGSSDYQRGLLSTIITIDSPLHGVDRAILSTASGISALYPPLRCAANGQVASTLINFHENDSARTATLMEATTRAKQRGVKVVNVGNTYDCLWLPATCNVPLPGGDIATQWIFNSEALNIILDVPEPCLGARAFCIKGTHSAVLKQEFIHNGLREIANQIGRQN